MEQLQSMGPVDISDHQFNQNLSQQQYEQQQQQIHKHQQMLSNLFKRDMNNRSAAAAAAAANYTKDIDYAGNYNEVGKPFL